MNQDWVLPDHVAPAMRKARAGEPVWTLTRGAKRLTCRLRYHGEYGVEALTLLDGELYMGRRFDTRAAALDETQIMHAQCIAHGWGEA